MTGSQARRLLRAGREHPVSNVELFFDLVFIVAFTRLTRGLAVNLNVYGALRMLLLLAAIWWVWTVTAWSTDWFEPEHPFVRGLLVWVMFGALMMAAAVPTAFGASAHLFAATYIAIHLGRGIALLYVLRGHPAQVRSARVAIWFALTGVLWIVGASTPSAREPLWAAAVAIDALIGLIGYPVPGLGRATQEELRVVGEHTSNRYTQLFIVAIGDLILVSGISLSDTALDAPHSAAFALAFINALAFAQIYFPPAKDQFPRILDRSRAPGRLALLIGYIHYAVLAGVLATAAANELIIRHAAGPNRGPYSLLLLSGSGMFLAGRSLLLLVTHGRLPLMCLIGLGALVAVWPATAALPVYCLTAGVDLVLLAVLILDRAFAVRANPTIGRLASDR